MKYIKILIFSLSQVIVFSFLGQEDLQKLRIEAEKGNAEAQYILGTYLFSGEKIKEDRSAAVKLFEKSAEQGYVKAQRKLGMCLCGGYGIKKNIAEGLKWLSKAEKQGDAIAAFSLGGRYFYGDGVEKNVDLAAMYFRKAAEMGDADAQKALGLCYEDGIGVDADIKQALKWYKAAAQQGYEKAIEKLDSMQGEYASIIDSIPSAEDIVKMGDSYLTGENGMPKDENKALACFMEAAEQGDEIAQYKLFLHHLKEKNKLEAAKLCHRLAKRAFSVGQYWFGRCCDEGYGVEQNVLESVKWFWRAAAGGYADAQYKLAKLYNGYGSYLRYNPLKAKELYQLAANQGHEDAKQALEKDLLIPDNFKPSLL